MFAGGKRNNCNDAEYGNNREKGRLMFENYNQSINKLLNF